MTHTIARRLRTELGNHADAERAAQQQAYMKSSMPYLGVPMPMVRRLSRNVFRANPLNEAAEWQRAVLDIWRNAGFREERYGAIELLGHRPYRPWLTPHVMPLLDELIVTGAWWDYVDALSQLVGEILSGHAGRMTPLLRAWAVDDDIWRRRTAILAQLKFKDGTDEDLLFHAVDASKGESEFFLQKAIGWALREYSKTRPEVVLRYVRAQRNALSPLSKREALKVLLKQGQVDSVP